MNQTKVDSIQYDKLLEEKIEIYNKTIDKRK